MHIEFYALQQAVDAGLVGRDQAQRLWRFLAERQRDLPSFRMTHILYYLGGLIAIGAMTLFIDLGWERYGGWGLAGIAVAYALLGLGLTERLVARALSIPAGILATFVVVLTPLAVYGLQAGLGLWPPGAAYRDFHYLVDWRWLLMELATLAVGAVLLWRYRLPYLVMPVAVTLWYMGMDLTPFLFGDPSSGESWWEYWELRKLVSVGFGLLTLLLALYVDLRSRKSALDYAFWLYLFGLLSFWGGLSALESHSELARLGYLATNLVLIFFGAALSRRAFAAFGGLGVAGYLAHLAEDVFRDSLLFPFVLSFIGFGVIGLGLVWQRHEQRIERAARALLPAALAELVERRLGPTSDATAVEQRP